MNPLQTDEIGIRNANTSVLQHFLNGRVMDT